MAKTLIVLKGDSQDTRLNCHQTHTHGIQFFQVNSPGWHKWNSCTLRTYCCHGNEKYALGTIRCGDTFKMSIKNNFGVVTVSALGTTEGFRVEGDSASYLRFGI